MKHTSIFVFVIALFFGCGKSKESTNGEQIQSKQWDGTVVQHGEMHEVIGQQKHHGRVLLNEAVERPHLFAVGALAELSGEFTVYDGEVFATKVDSPGKIVAADSARDLQATLLVGCHVPDWIEHTIGTDINNDELETYIEEAAGEYGIDTALPFPFVIVGELHELEFHVINGSCPVHSKRNGVELAEDIKPYHNRYESIQGTTVGIFANNASGEITHPGSSTHTHVIFQDDKSENKVTGHIEKFGVAKGAVLRLPRLQQSP